MKTLLLLVALVGSTYATNSFGNPCYECSDFSRQGQGFMGHSNTTMCCYYYECWRVDGATTLDSYMRTCPPGTWYNDPSGSNGSPCTASKPHEECVDVCGSQQTVTPTTCHLYPNPANTRQFGTLNPPPDGPWEFQGECAVDFVFDHGACTCVRNPSPCFCMVNLVLSSDVDDYSCHGGQVVNSENPVTMVTAVALPTGNAAAFSGPDALTFLSLPMFGGLYDGCHVNCLSLGLFFNPANHPRVDPQGLVMYGDCGEGSTYGIFLENNFIVGHVDGLVVFHENAVVQDQWHYVSLVFKRRRNHSTLFLYLMTVAEAVDCAENCNCPDPVASDILPVRVCVDARSCGLTVGFSGSSSEPSEMFEGMLGRVQVSHKCSPMACEGHHCMKRGRRRW